MVGVKIELQGLPELHAKLRPGTLIGSAMADAMNEIGRGAAESARAKAPRRTGRMGGSVKHQVLGKTSPIARIVVEARAPKSNYRYPRLLEYVPKWGHREWLKKAVAMWRARAGVALAGAAHKIESNWRR